MELVPQGSFAEKLRAGGAGIPAFFTKSGVGSIVGDGGIVTKFKKGGKEIEKVSLGKEMRIFDGERYLMVHSIRSDYSMVKGWKADTKGNVIFNKSAQNFNTDLAKAGKTTIVEVEEIVPAGTFDPGHVHLPHVYVQRLIQGTNYIKPIENRTIHQEDEDIENNPVFQGEIGMRKKRIAKRAAKLVKDGDYINLGIGIPVLTTNFIDPNFDVTFQSENGILGLGGFPKEEDVDADLINAGKQTVTTVTGASFMSSSETFAMIRGGHLDITFLGGMQVSEKGDLANWIIPGKMVKGMGGAMDLVAGTKQVVVVMQHVAKNGAHKVLRECSLPVTGERVVDTLITDKAVFEWDLARKMWLKEVAEDSSVEEIRGITDSNYEIAPDLGTF